MKPKNILTSLILILIFSLAVFAQDGRRGENLHAADEAITARLRQDGVKYETKRAILWVEKDSLTQKEIEEFGTLVNQGISDIERFTGIRFDKKYYGTKKMEYFIGSKNGISRASLDKTPYIYLASDRIKEKKVPYLHETAHKIVYKSVQSLWLAEGYATYVQTSVAKTYGGFDANPFNPENADIHQTAKNVLKMDVSKKLLPLIGLNGVPGNMSVEQREIYRPIFEDRRVTATAFYNLSTSFVKFMAEKVGVKKLSKVFESPDSQAEIFKVTGKKVDDWKAEWLKSLT